MANLLMANLHFTKMHGLGNDFVVVAANDTDALPTAKLWRALADRRTGIGFDQALVILPPRQADATAYYRIFNADGGEVEQCGNGVRCVAEWLRMQGRATAPLLKLDSSGGRVEAAFVAAGMVAVNMGVPRFASTGESMLQVDGEEVLFTEVSMGNPHIVLRVPSVEEAPVGTLGARLESHQRFPQRTNVGFLQVIDPAHARLRVFERGVGETKACGTGACAAMASARRQGLLAAEAEISLPGGALQLRWQGEGSNLWMTGPATVAFRGEVDLSQFA
jgi:diaminopimelate epimerase